MAAREKERDVEVALEREKVALEREKMAEREREREPTVKIG